MDRTEHLTNPRFPLFHVPHDGRLLPKELLASVCVPMREFLFYTNPQLKVEIRFEL